MEYSTDALVNITFKDFFVLVNYCHAFEDKQLPIKQATRFPSSHREFNEPPHVLYSEFRVRSSSCK